MGTLDSRGAVGAPRHPGRKQHKNKIAGIASDHGEVEMDLRVQLKVCEGCGCLWYRAQNHSGVYCLGCDAKLKQFPSAESRRRRGPKKGTTLIRIWAVAEAAGGV